MLKIVKARSFLSQVEIPLVCGFPPVTKHWTPRICPSKERPPGQHPGHSN